MTSIKFVVSVKRRRLRPRLNNSSELQSVGRRVPSEESSFCLGFFFLPIGRALPLLNLRLFVTRVRPLRVLSRIRFPPQCAPTHVRGVTSSLWYTFSANDGSHEICGVTSRPRYTFSTNDRSHEIRLRQFRTVRLIPKPMPALMKPIETLVIRRISFPINAIGLDRVGKSSRYRYPPRFGADGSSTHIVPHTEASPFVPFVAPTHSRLVRFRFSSAAAAATTSENSLGS